MGKRITKLIITLLVLNSLYGTESYEILHLSQDARSLALNNSTSAYDSFFLQNNPAALSMRSKGYSYSYMYFPANIHFVGTQKIWSKNKCIFINCSILYNCFFRISNFFYFAKGFDRFGNVWKFVWNLCVN